ncbi:MAG: hypothetical protein A2W91_16170 [Bacteroidetes bacterium GWF2_38_335]|nr:MAG: hypothetical protein A2W91_16170 [Bacteroidetes bacterium GWF2_38_335]OFY81226.1 MAG: hypothetical protein A2281_07145 [Bacteroidetes bacterium RIFOXYA12_FULL_38_20]HBS85342.1 hypothetical protein [Bacteroidales bacterium]
MKNIFKAFCLAIIIGFTACDIVEEPFYEGTGPDPIPEKKYRKILIEDYTGHFCTNCPTAHDTMYAIEDYYNINDTARVVALSIHAGDFAFPYPDFGYPEDFRTSVGDELDAYFQVSSAGLPKGLVNRKENEDGLRLDADDWRDAIKDIFQISELADIYLTINNTYNSGTNQVTTTVTTEYIVDMEGTYNLCVFLCEDSIIAPQLEHGDLIPDYRHMHMLRKSFNGTWGEEVGSGTNAAETSLDKTYTLSLAGNVPENCYVIAFVINMETDEVIQAEKKKVK